MKVEYLRLKNDFLNTKNTKIVGKMLILTHFHFLGEKIRDADYEFFQSLETKTIQNL